ncbi:hypothetical protein QNA08_15485 [Chelatococcus sp. SYSU_G07232]|uniref:Uncharacterized protein n=1 Tax=Chelatococcus albus TaxID=3047466 RepID=A0ABT7AJS5_9HYPH|nr:hypothetical protein [Chelatococcus sp. SYSU_G07232]MDJ1159627.1 hypothetical protein [Chelatococcus sp. SYSU_G07232]
MTSGDPSDAPERPEPAQAPIDETIDSTFRNGSLTAIGVLVGFPLGFLTRWAVSPGPWSATDLIAVSLITAGITVQITALASMLSVRSLVLARHNRAVRIFVAGLVLVSIGVVVAIFLDVLGFQSTVFHD